MTLQLKSTGSVYETSDPGGWYFKIETFFEPNYGWTARVVVGASGSKEERAEIEHLRTPLRRLLAQLDAEFDAPGGHK